LKKLPPRDGFWINHPQETLEGIPIADRDVKSQRRGSSARSIFNKYSLGISTNRDEWLYDFDVKRLATKADLIITKYNEVRSNTKLFPDSIKWSETLKRRKAQGNTETYSKKRIRSAAYRPFVGRWLYQSSLFIDRPGLVESFFPPGKDNVAICFSDKNSRAPYCVLATNRPTDLHFGASSDGYQQVARYRYVDGERHDNITEWAFRQFKGRYETERQITKDAVFQYVYGILHDPVYREKYALNLRRSFPHIPFYSDFWKWADWGSELLELHVRYEDVTPWPLKRIDKIDVKSRNAGLAPRVVLRADMDGGAVHLNGETTLMGIPDEAWDYVLGTRSAIAWVLDQYTERSFGSQLLREKIRPFSFVEHKEEVIALIGRVVRISVDTERIIAEMKKVKAR